VVFVLAAAAMESTLAAYVAVLSWRFSLAPGWRDQRWFAVAALTAAGYSALNLPVTVSAVPALVVACTRTQVCLGALHAACWVRYAHDYLREPVPRPDRWLAWTVAGLGVLALVPGVVYRSALHVRDFVPFGIQYRDPEATWLGDAALLLIVGVFVLVLFRFWRAAGRGTAHARAHAVAIGALLLLVVNDALNVAGVIMTPYLLDLAFVIPVVAVGYMLSARVATDARALAEMRLHLEGLVENRTRDLVTAQEALHRSEKLAALGQLAAGVAHEVNSPATVVAANLTYLRRQIEAGSFPDDALRCVQESSVAVVRITSMARQMLDAGRLAATGAVSRSVPLAAVAREALRTALPRCPSWVALLEEIPEDLCAFGQDGILHQVLVNLVVNGAQAVPEGRPGRVSVSGRQEGRRVLLTVADDGAGMSPEVLRRVFEPFFTTKPFGTGHGLGLSISRGLVASMGGDLRLESEPGRGTRATVELPEAVPGEPAGPAD
jgi:signal transduction histidine kinase